MQKFSCAADWPIVFCVHGGNMINKYSDERMMDFASKYSDEPATKFKITCLENAEGTISIDVYGYVDEYSASIHELNVFVLADDSPVGDWTEVTSYKQCEQLFKQHNMEQLVINEIGREYGIYTEKVRL